MFPWDQAWNALSHLLAFLGGGAFAWRLFDVYRDRVRVELTDITYNYLGKDGPQVTMELDNNGRHPLLLKREATIYGLHLSGGTPGGPWVRPRIRVGMRLLGDRRVEPITSQRLRWQLAKDDLPPGSLYFTSWLRLTFRLSSRRRRVTARLPRLGSETVGPLYYWIGYLVFRYRGKSMAIAPKKTAGEQQRGGN